MIEAMKHYEAALLKAFPKGASGDVFEHWNKARKAIAEAGQDKPVAWMMHNSSGDEISITESNLRHRQPAFVQNLWKDSTPLYTHPQPKAEKQEPVAVVTGVYGGRFIVEPINSAMVLPENMALYAQPQRQRVVFPTMLRQMWSGGEVQAWLDEHVNKE